MRIYQISEEAKLSNRVLVQLLQDQGLDVSSHMAPLAEEDEELLRDLIAEIRKDTPEPEPEPEPVVEEEVEPEVEPVAEVEEEPVEATAEPGVVAETAPKAERPRDAEKEPSPDFHEKPPKPAGRRVKKIQEREVIEQSLVEMEEEGKPEEKKPEEPARKGGAERTRTFRFHKRGGQRGTLRRRTKTGPQAPTLPTGPVDIVLPISVKDLSQALGVKVQEIIKVLMHNDVIATINARLDRDTVEILALEFEREILIKEKVAAEEAFLTNIEEEEDRPEDLMPRPPIVAMLGHVDHGKTSLLDYIRSTDVAAKEAGGITQHISSYKITTEEGKEVVFIDLPGHEAFTDMRGRGAQATDIVILVIAAEEGVMPQTEECINHAKAAEVPVIVALNKCDKQEANPQLVKQRLSSHGLIAEEWSGDTQMVETSATTGLGIPDLLEAILLQAEVMELQSNPHKKAQGIVLEAEKSEGRGVLATVLVQDGTLRAGDMVLGGTGFGRVRDIRNDSGESVQMVGPATPVEISGLSAVPEAGDRFFVVENLARAKAIAEERARRLREESLAEKQTLSLADLFRKAGETATSEVPIIIKADTKGSVQAIAQKLESLGTSEVKIKILHGAVGSVNESDVQLASASQAIILGFNVIAEDRARALAHEKGVQIQYFQIIYELIDAVKLAMEQQLAPEQRESITGHANIRAVFRSSKMGNIAGSYVTDGIMRRNSRARLVRDGRVIYDKGVLESVRRFKDDVKEVREGFECGLKISGYDDVKEGDVIESYEVQEFARTLEDSAAESE